jgi:hypothetical protein
MKLHLLPATLLLAGVVLSIPTLGQQSSPGPPSVVDAAREAQSQKPTSSTPLKVITNDDLARQSRPATPAATPQDSLSTSAVAPQTQAAEPSKPAPQAADTSESGDCHNPAGNEAIHAELQAAQDELDQLRLDLAYDPKVISGNNLDMTNFKPGASGVDMGSPPLSQTQPQSPERIKEVELQQRIASLKRAAVITCDTPENGAIQRQIDEAQKQLTLAQRELDLDSSTYYSNPNYTQDTAGKTKIDAEQEQVQTLQSEVERLKQELAASQSN